MQWFGKRFGGKERGKVKFILKEDIWTEVIYILDTC